mgnify:CR=1 FL=1
MALIRPALKRLYLIEGFVSDHALDSGGYTVYGIAKQYWPAYYEKWGGAPTRVQANEFYGAEF